MHPENESDYLRSTSEPSEELAMYTPSPDNSEPVSLPADDPKQYAPKPDEEPVHWTASEYIHESKGGLWFAIFAVVVVVLILSDILFMKSYTFSVLVIVMAAAIVIYSRRPPRTLEYTLSGNQGLFVGERLYHFNDFKAFGLIRDGEHHSIMLIPVKRFDPGVSVYFPEEVGERIVDILGARLPMENLKLDLVDIIVRKLHL